MSAYAAGGNSGGATLILKFCSTDRQTGHKMAPSSSIRNCIFPQSHTYTTASETVTDRGPGKSTTSPIGAVRLAKFGRTQVRDHFPQLIGS